MDDSVEFAARVWTNVERAVAAATAYSARMLHDDTYVIWDEPSMGTVTWLTYTELTDGWGMGTPPSDILWNYHDGFYVPQSAIVGYAVRCLKLVLDNPSDYVRE